jgi:hypothetical protein
MALFKDDQDPFTGVPPRSAERAWQLFVEISDDQFEALLRELLDSAASELRSLADSAMAQHDGRCSLARHPNLGDNSLEPADHETRAGEARCTANRIRRLSPRLGRWPVDDCCSRLEGLARIRDEAALATRKLRDFREAVAAARLAPAGASRDSLRSEARQLFTELHFHKPILKKLRGGDFWDGLEAGGIQ